VTSRTLKNRIRLGIFLVVRLTLLHVGHLILADEARFQLNLDRVLWVLTPCPPHKGHKQITDIDQRRVLLQAALDQNPNFELNSTDLDRPAPHYAVDTLNILHAEFLGKLSWFILWAGIHLTICPTGTTHPVFSLLQMKLESCAARGIHRSTQTGADGARNFPKSRVFGCAVRGNIFSHIRSRVSEGGAFRYYLSAPVYELILKLNLYKTGERD